MPVAEAIRRFTAAPVARLTTVGPDLTPHVVPAVFAVLQGPDGVVIYSGLDGKPKSTMRLRRLSNIAENPRVSVLVDHYEADWARLWWVRADGTATVHDGDRAAAEGRRLLRAKYPQYQDVSLDGPMLAIRVRRWSGWWASE